MGIVTSHVTRTSKLATDSVTQINIVVQKEEELNCWVAALFSVDGGITYAKILVIPTADFIASSRFIVQRQSATFKPVCWHYTSTPSERLWKPHPNHGTGQLVNVSYKVMPQCPRDKFQENLSPSLVRACLTKVRRYVSLSKDVWCKDVCFYTPPMRQVRIS
jgi:hypothetical protein